MVTRNLLTLLVILLIGVLAWGVLTMPDRRTTGQRIGDAVDALPNVDRASREIQPRTPGQKLGDAVRDAGQNIKDNTAP